MRCATNGRYPRWVCWENVVGAFSSNGGRDFKAVLDAVIGIAGPGATVPMPEKNRWPYADVYMGDGWSVAYRVLTRNFGESPSEGAAVTLSEILQADAPDGYYLSPKACRGILRRASARGKELPAILRLALERQAGYA